MVRLEEAKRWLGITDTAQDVLLTELEANVAAFIERQTGRSFATEGAVDEILDSDGSGVLWLSEVPKAGTTVTISYRSGVGGTWTVAPSTAFEVEAAGRRVFVTDNGVDILIAGPGLWRKGLRIYRAQYTSGYSSFAVPGDIKLLALSLMGAIRSRKGAEGLSSESDGITSRSYTATADALAAIPWAQKTINAWKSPLL